MSEDAADAARLLLALRQLARCNAVARRIVIGQQRSTQPTRRVDLEIPEQPRHPGFERESRQRRALQESGAVGAGDVEEFVVADRPLFLALDQLAKACVDAQAQLARESLVLVEGFPLELAVGLVDQHRGRDREGEEKCGEQRREAPPRHGAAIKR